MYVYHHHLMRQLASGQAARLVKDGAQAPTARPARPARWPLAWRPQRPASIPPTCTTPA